MISFKKILKPLLLIKKLISCSVPSPLERVRERWFVIGWGFLLLFSCDDMEDKLKPLSNTGSYEPTQLYILSEGLFNWNNSTLASYDLTTNTLVSDFFLTANKRGLGDTANDMKLYGSKLYVVVDQSSQIDVIDPITGKSLKQIPLFKENGDGRQPRFIEFYKGKAYVCSFDGTVAKIDTASLKIEAFVQCGKNPDGICVANNKIYVANSGGLNFPNYDNTVSVIDLNTFTEIKKITVGVNPGVIHADSEGDVYVISRGNYGANPYKFQRINSVSDTLTETFDDIQALNFAIHNDTAYIYNYNFTTQSSDIKVFDCKKEIVISENFITDGTVLNTPFGIDVNPVNGDVYLTDAKSYTVFGDVLCFKKNGKLKFRIKEVGLNPKKVVFK